MALNTTNISENVLSFSPRGLASDIIPTNSQIDTFLAGIRNTTAAINLPPTPYIPYKKNKPKIHPTPILQINLQHSKLATANLAKLSETKSFLICLVQEPWITKRGISGIPPHITKQHTTIKKDDPPIRAAILHTRSQNIWPIPHFSDRDICTCIWNAPTKLGQTEEIWLISAYWAGQDKDLPPKLIQTIEHCTNSNIKFICGMDSNAHSNLWGSTTSDRRGALLEDLIFQFGLNLLNRGSTPTFHSPVGKSVIDITLTSNNMIDSVLDWKVLNESSLSDHKYIKFFSTTPKQNIIEVRPLKKADWPLFQQELALPWEDPPATWSNNTIETELNYLYNRITSALDVACPKKFITESHRLTWWNTELDESRHRVRRAHHLAQKRGGNYWTEYNLLRREHKYAVRTAKTNSWREFTTSSNNTSAIAKLNKIIHHQQNKNSIGLLKRPNDNGHTQTISETLQVLMSEHFPNSTPTTPSTTPSHTNPLPPTNHNWINENLYHKAVNKFGSDKAPGPDGFKPIILQKLNSKAIRHLLSIFQACITNGYTPQIWRQSRTIFIPKLNKEDYTNARSFRPISLTSFFFKTLERLVLWNLENSCLTQIPYHPNQHAFRKGHSTDTALTEAIQRIEKAFNNKNYYLAVFLDIEGAFDNITNEAIIKGMKEHRVPDTILAWYTHYLHNRTCYSSLGKETVTVQVAKGTPQGGVLSPPGWNMNYDTLLQLIIEAGIDATGFADDLLAGIEGNNPEQLVAELQTVLNNIVAWGNNCGLKFSPTKSTAILFHRKQKKPIVTPLKLNQTNIPYSTITKYLGMTIDRKLNWTSHIKQKSKMAKSLLYLSKRAVGSTWGPQPYLAKWAYTGIVRPKLTFGCHLWANCAQQKSKNKDFTSIQRAALLPLGPVRDHTPTFGLEIITNTPPIDLHIIELSLNTLRTINRLDKNLWKGTIGNKESHLHFLQEITDSIHLSGLPDDKTPASYPIQTGKSFTVNLNSLTNREAFEPSSTQTPLEIYTDGSRLQNRTGFGYCILQNNGPSEQITLAKGSGFLGSEASVFQAETYAIEAAIYHLESLAHEDKNLQNIPLTIHSDSQATLKSLKNQPTYSKTTLSCQNTLLQASINRDITLRWVKAHCGISGNEMADEQAKLGACTITSGPDPWLPLPTTFFKKTIKNLINFHWTQRWINNKTCRQTKLFFQKPNPKITKQIMQCTKTNFGKAIRWLTGHCFLKRHNHLLDPINNPDPLCRHCKEEEETPWHIIARCGAFQHIRLQYFNLHELPENFEWEGHDLLNFLKHPSIDQIESDIP